MAYNFGALLSATAGVRAKQKAGQMAGEQERHQRDAAEQLATFNEFAKRRQLEQEDAAMRQRGEYQDALIGVRDDSNNIRKALGEQSNQIRDLATRQTGTANQMRWGEGGEGDKNRSSREGMNTADNQIALLVAGIRAAAQGSRSQRPMRVTGADGKPYLLNPETGEVLEATLPEGFTLKPPSAGEVKNAQNATMMGAAVNQINNSPVPKNSDRALEALKSTPLVGGVVGALANKFQSPSAQTRYQGEEQLVQSYALAVTGQAASDPLMKRLTSIVKTGLFDSPEVLKAKEATRNMMVRVAAQGAGRAPLSPEAMLSMAEQEFTKNMNGPRAGTTVGRHPENPYAR